MLAATEISPAAYAAKIINQTNRHIFLTGKAGTGKTTFLKNILLHTHKKSIVVAPTGIAAINAGGVTIHSQFQLPFGPFVPSREYRISDPNVKVNNPDTLLRNLQIRGSKKELLRSLELLIIDEVSMLRADLLDAISLVLKSVRRNPQAFGGVQVLFIGDLLQLPPVVKEDEWSLLRNYYKSIFFFDAQVLEQDKPLYIELDKIYRQNDPEFINLLNNLRNNIVNIDDVALLNKYYKPDFKPEKNENYITLTTHNYRADAINKTALDELKGRSYFFEAEVNGEFNEYAYPVDKKLELKVGAQIMFIKNDLSGDQKFFNGRIGTVKSIIEKNVWVRFSDGFEIPIEKYEWKNIKYELNQVTNEIEEREVGSFKQFPIKLAWAITVHKSQGLTFEKAILDINSAFAPGQVYVALSRLKSMDGLVLTAPADRLNTSQDEKILAFSQTKNNQGDLQKVIEKETFAFMQCYLLKSFNFKEIMVALDEHTRSYDKQENKSEKQKYQSWAISLKQEIEPIQATADKFIRQIAIILDNKEAQYLQTLYERIEKAVAYFSPMLKEFSKKVMAQQQIVKQEKKTKAYLQELAALEIAFFKQLESINKTLALIKSIKNNSEFTKSSVNEVFNKEERSKEVEELSKYIGKGAKKTAKTPKENKPDTKLATFELYNQGLSIEEIAKTRNYAFTTIEGHLAHFVATGTLPVSKFVTEEKVNKIIETSTKLDTTLFGTLKQELGDDFSYSELKFSISYKKFLEEGRAEVGELSE